MEEAAQAVADAVGAAFSGSASASPAAPIVVAAQTEEVVAFQFDADFQNRIIYLATTDQIFMRRVAHLLRPEYFENPGNALFSRVILDHWKKYSSVLQDVPVIILAVKNAAQSRVIRPEDVAEVKEVIQRVFKEQDLLRSGAATALNASFVADQIASFAQTQAVISAIMKSADLIAKGSAEFDKIRKIVTDAVEVGLDEEEEGGEYFEGIADRSRDRAQAVAGMLPPRGITTGNPYLDDLLYHKGFGRRELSVLMGGAKAGKTMALIEFATAAALANKNVLYVTLEVSRGIIGERMDARYSEVAMKDLVPNFDEVNKKVEALAASGSIGKLWVSEFPSGSLTPAKLRALLERHKAKGWVYDMVVVDYADIMAPDYRTNDPIENSKWVYIGLRAIAQEWNIALLTATQSNREGFKAVVAKAEHVSEDFNKVRIADLFISINSTEEERKDGKARLFFAASRNQASGMSVFIEQDFHRARFLKRVERVE